MVYIKSLFVGIITAVMTTIISIILWMAVTIYEVQSRFHGEVGFDMRSMLVRPSSVWLATLVGFGLGFYWQYRRTLRKR